VESPVQAHGEADQYVAQTAGGYEDRHEQEAPVEATRPRPGGAADPGSIRAGDGRILVDDADRRALEDLRKTLGFKYRPPILRFETNGRNLRRSVKINGDNF